MRISCFGKNYKKVIDTETNIIYDSLRDAAAKNNLNYSCLSEMLNNKRNNKTNLKWQN